MENFRPGTIARHSTPAVPMFVELLIQHDGNQGTQALSLCAGNTATKPSAAKIRSPFRAADGWVMLAVDFA